MKYEWKKSEKEAYGAKEEPRILQSCKQNYLMIQGKGNPNDPDFSQRVATLYALAYGVKMHYKALPNEVKTKGIDDFSVYPLEGVWVKEEMELIKEHLQYTIMIKQPDVITKEMVDIAFAKVKKKKPMLLVDEVYFDAIEEGMCVDILHVGSFDDEPMSFQKMDAFLAQNNLKRSKDSHREIYLNNANRVVKCKLKTILRYQVG